MTESMYKEGLHDTFEIVEAPIVHCYCLNRVDHTFFEFVPEVLVYREVVEEGVEDEWAQILEEEESSV